MNINNLLFTRFPPSSDSVRALGISHSSSVQDQCDDYLLNGNISPELRIAYGKVIERLSGVQLLHMTFLTSLEVKVSHSE